MAMMALKAVRASACHPNAFRVSSRTGFSSLRFVTPRAVSSPARCTILPRTAKRHLQTQVFWLPPLMFVGLLGSLWVWKCMMMVVFQNKIIYMPGLPPNARRERIEDYARQCGDISWQARRIRAADGTDLAVCMTDVACDGSKAGASSLAAGRGLATPVYILYFQGNASSLPPRLQDLSWVLRALQGSSQPAHYTMVCLSYRGYWTSRGRPSEKGINLDAQAALRFVGQIHAEAYGEDAPKPLIIFWGQSIGSGIATNLAAWEKCPSSLKPGALVLETPFTSIRAMLLALYPPKWVPYRYLWPFLRNHLDSMKNLEMIAARRGDTTGEPYIALVEGGRDELVPAEHGAQLQQRCVELGLLVEKKTVQGAFHNDVMFRAEGRKAVAEAIERAVVARAQVRKKA
ncbi:hypothetical protein BN1723_003934 [Verticillium longisporum]|uniref:AB hydrolase-1 domain-containing protein n=1 Tax=Verticillium longisporum TaxID=100787 RepID=A0A0G4MR21_VERLO|nr:hypothetical protein BN1723_003934 [Verticillium longisporum]CRK36619.1 hypothetical protein BN1708_007132 [Verticillium longisporum]